MTQIEKEWRVRLWIRVISVLVFLLFAAEQVDIFRRVGRGEMPESELWYGCAFLATFAICAWILAFHPRVILTTDRIVEVINPTGKTRFSADEVVEVYPTSYGLAFRLRDGRRRWSIVFQATLSFGEPRWFDVAEAITGIRPELPKDEEDEDDAHS